MGVTGLDHVAITVADVDATIAWYSRVLDATSLHLDLWQSGQIPIALLQLGTCRLSIHPAKAPAAPHALRPTPGSADLCFRWEGPVAGITAHLLSSGVPVVAGPVGRPASNGERGMSVYVRDPDDNLIELLTITPDDSS